MECYIRESDVGVSVDALCRNDTGQISRDPCKNRPKNLWSVTLEK